MVVDDPDQIHRVHALEMEGEDVGLPHRVRARALETSRRPLTPAWLRWQITQVGLIDHGAHLLRAHLQPLVTPQIVADASHSVLGILPPQCQDLLFEHRALAAHGDRRRLAAQPCHPAFGVVLLPGPYGGRAHGHQLAHLSG